MLIFLPIFLPVAAALIILGLQRFRPGFGLSYFLAMLTGLATWGVVLAFRWYPPPAYAMASFIPIPGVEGSLIFQLDEVAWPYAFAIASLVAAALLTASARLAFRSIPSAWGGILIVGAASLFSIMAGSPIALALSWMIIDTIELALILATVNQPRLSQQAVLSFSARTMGTLFLLVAVAVSHSFKRELIIFDPGPEAGVFLVIAAGLRLGVLPLHLPYSAEVQLRRGLGTILRLASPAASLALLSRLPASAVPPSVSPFLLLFAALAGVYGAAMWLAADSEINARPYWLIALAGMAVASVVRGYPQASLAWGAATILCGGALFLFSARDLLRTRIPLVVCFAALTGLPFTLASGGWSGLVILPFNLPDLLFLASHIMLLAGFIRHFRRPGESLRTMERWVQVLYPAGLFLLAASTILASLFGWPESFSFGGWWVSPFSLLLAGGSWYLYLRFLPTFLAGETNNTTWLVALGRRASHVAGAILRLDWLYGLAVSLFRSVRRLILGSTSILEGEGGVLWVLVLLALMISFIISGGLP